MIEQPDQTVERHLDAPHGQLRRDGRPVRHEHHVARQQDGEEEEPGSPMGATRLPHGFTAEERGEHRPHVASQELSEIEQIDNFEEWTWNLLAL